MKLQYVKLCVKKNQHRVCTLTEMPHSKTKRKFKAMLSPQPLSAIAEL